MNGVAPAEPAGARAGPRAPDDGLAVLLVEDSPVLVERLREALGALPEVGELHAVDRQSAAVDALGRWDVVVVDLHLRQGNGFGVLREVRARAGGRAPVTIVFTNHDVPGYRARAVSLGADHFLDKSREFERLGDLLREIHAARAAANDA